MYHYPHSFLDYFPASALLRMSEQRESLREAAVRGPVFPWSERHVQCAWYDPAHRPLHLTSTSGESVEVEHPGAWNLEAGPDFLGATLLLGPDRRRISGDVEIHIRPSDWNAHGHADDPAFAGVRVHVTWFSGRTPSNLPSGTVQIALRESFEAVPGLSLDHIEPSAYPYAARGPETPCFKALRTWSPDQREALLAAAGQERMRLKTERLARRASEEGLEQALYEDIMTALGYHRNKVPFRVLARTVPVDRLREASGSDPELAYAILTGVSGLIPQKTDPAWDTATRYWLKKLRAAWWKQSEQWAERALPSSIWRLSGLRPSNHPLRRLAAAATLCTMEGGLAPLIEVAAKNGAGAAKKFSCSLQKIEDPFWSHHLALGSPTQPRKQKLIGKTRADEMAVNILVPALALLDFREPFEGGLLNHLPTGQDNRIARMTAWTLFGADAPSSLTRDGLRRQGLLHVFHTHCLDDRSRCAGCVFPPENTL